MELYIYDCDLAELGLIEKISSFIWTRRYWRAGSFKLLVPFTDKHSRLLQAGSLVTMRSDAEAGEIQFVEKRKNSQGKEEIEVQGNFITGWLGRRIVLNPITATATPQNIISRIVSENITSPADANRRIDNITHTPITNIQRPNIQYASEPLINALLSIEQIAKAAQLGFHITADIRTGRRLFNIYDGADLTIGQQQNPPAVFSVELDNVLEQTFTRCTEQVRTTAYVGGEATAMRPRRIVEVGQAAGLGRAEVFISAADIINHLVYM